ncbi:MAG: DinB family protein [Candidatus Zixiibacteriota bacterium]
MKKWEMRIARGYDPRTQNKIGLFAAQLDDQLKRLRKEVGSLTIKQLEWQLKPGMNTVGMLLAHISFAEVWWMKIAANELPWEPEGKKIMARYCSIEDDGLPLSPDGHHPSFLKGFTAEKYLSILAKGRRAIHSEMKKWRDRDLDDFYKVGKGEVSHAATLYHVLEHFCGHFGQILLLKHLMRDAGILRKQEKAKS